MESNGHGHFYVSIGSFLGSVASFMYAHFTTANIAWLIGCVAGAVSIYAGVLTIREKQMRIRQLKDSLYKPDKYNENTQS
jgi:uncharacterized membrane protein YcjF (UPF0283 family)